MLIHKALRKDWNAYSKETTIAPISVYDDLNSNMFVQVAELFGAVRTVRTRVIALTGMTHKMGHQVGLLFT